MALIINGETILLSHDPDEIDEMLAQELAEERRRDAAVTLLEQFATAPYAGAHDELLLSIGRAGLQLIRDWNAVACAE